jgi:hypothetical protein
MLGHTQATFPSPNCDNLLGDAIKSYGLLPLSDVIWIPFPVFQSLRSRLTSRPPRWLPCIRNADVSDKSIIIAIQETSNLISLIVNVFGRW